MPASTPGAPRYPSSFINGVPPGTRIQDNILERREESTFKDVVINANLNAGAGYTTPFTGSITFLGGNGTGATFAASATGGTVTSVTVLTGGSGYQAPAGSGLNDGTIPLIFSLPSGSSGGSSLSSGSSGTAVSGFATITGGVVTGATIVSGGAGYGSGIVYASIPNQGINASATGTTVGGKFTAITVTGGGSGYTEEPTVVITDASGSQAVAQAFVENGTVVNVLILNAEYPTDIPVGESDYTNETNLYLDLQTAVAQANSMLTTYGTALTTLTTAGVGSGANFLATVPLGGGAITSVVIQPNTNSAVSGAVLGGSGYLSGGSGTLPLVFTQIPETDATGYGAAGTATITNGVVTAVTLTSGGAGYTDAAEAIIVTVAGVDPNAKAYYFQRDALQIYRYLADIEDLNYWVYKEINNLNQLIADGSLGTSKYPSGWNRGY